MTIYTAISIGIIVGSLGGLVFAAIMWRRQGRQ